MRYLALCSDYDGTLASQGRVDEPTVAALEELRASGRKLVLVTGRELDDLRTVFDRLDLFDRIVAENGALIFRPATREERALGEAPPARFVEELRRRGVDRISVGRCILATWEPHEKIVLETIRDLGLDLQVIFNKGAVMVLPAGVNKATGLRAALDELNVSVHNAVGVGDAENDHAFMNICECSAAVANALPAVKDTADIVLQADHGAGVSELIRAMLDEDLAGIAPSLARHEILLGHEGESAVTLPTYGTSALVVGTSGGGKSTVATGLVERLREKAYSFCIIDPEGDYDIVEGAVVLGSPTRAPSIDECVQLLNKPEMNAVIDLVGLKFSERPAFFMKLFAQILELRAKTGRPHWLIVDEAHHVLPVEWKPTDPILPAKLDGIVLVSVTPAAIAPQALKLVDSAVVLGEEPRKMFEEFAAVHGVAAPAIEVERLPPGEALYWRKDGAAPPKHIVLEPSRGDRRRHLRKYAQGELSEEDSFFFRGPEQKLKLRAHNLILFTDLADGVDADTWLHHWRQGDVSAWMRKAIKDDGLADSVVEIERDLRDDADESRRRVRALIEERYTLPAEPNTPH